jgi:hypothetical protein
MKKILTLLAIFVLGGACVFGGLTVLQSTRPDAVPNAVMAVVPDVPALKQMGPTGEEREAACLAGCAEQQAPCMDEAKQKCLAADIDQATCDEEKSRCKTAHDLCAVVCPVERMTP